MHKHQSCHKSISKNMSSETHSFYLIFPNIVRIKILFNVVLHIQYFIFLSSHSRFVIVLFPVLRVIACQPPLVKRFIHWTQRLLPCPAANYNDAASLFHICFLLIQSKTRYSEGKFKRAQDAARDAKFSAIFGIAFGIAIALFFLWLYVIVPAF